MSERVEDGGPAEIELVDPSDTGAAILRLLNKQYRLEDEISLLRAVNAEMLAAAIELVASSDEYEAETADDDRFNAAVEDLRAVIARSPSEPLNARTQGVEGGR